MSTRVFVKALVVALSLLVVLQFGGRGNRTGSAVRVPAPLFGEAELTVVSSTTATLASSNVTGAVCEHPPDDPVEACAYVQRSECTNEHELLDYLYFHYCTLRGLQPLSYVLLFAWLVTLLYMLGSTAEAHFCPALSHISDTLHLSPDVAGITILAFGNGSPDVFSIFAGVQQGNFNIALNELTGSGCFVTMCVVSAVALVSNARLDRYPFLRDASLYFCAQALVFGVVFDGKIELWESLCLLAFYFCYVALVVVVQIVQKRRARRAALAAADDDNDEHSGDESNGPIDAGDEAGALGWGASRDVQSLLDSMKSTDDDPAWAMKSPRNRAVQLTVLPTLADDDREGESATFSLQANAPLSPRSRRVRALTSDIAGVDVDDDDDDGAGGAGDDADSVRDDALEAAVDFDALKSSLLSVTDFAAFPSSKTRRGRALSTVEQREIAASVDAAPAPTSSFANMALGAAASMRTAVTNLSAAVSADRLAAQLRRNRRQLRRLRRGNEPAVLRRRGIHLDPLRHSVSLGDNARASAAAAAMGGTGTNKTSGGGGGVSGVPGIVQPSRGSGGGAGDDGDDYSDSDSDDEMIDEPDAHEGNMQSHMSARSLTALLGRRAVVAKRPWVVRAFRSLRSHARDVTEWRDKGRIGKALFALMSPLHALLWATVPHVEDGVWHRGLTATTLVGSMGVVSLALRLWTVGLGPVPLPVLLLGIALVLAAAFYFCASKYSPPKHRLPLVLLAFFVSILWIYMTANELVSLLKFFGIAFNISAGILGLTVLAWGNSIGDFVANTVVARQGFPEMAISAAFGGPLFNMVFGLGMAVTYSNVRSFPEPLHVQKITNQSLTAFLFLSTGLLMSLVTIPLTKFVIRRWYAGVLITLYVTGTACGLLAEFGILNFGLPTGDPSN
jgi:Ca2+/Na+ antiporter